MAEGDDGVVAEVNDGEVVEITEVVETTETTVTTTEMTETTEVTETVETTETTEVVEVVETVDGAPDEAAGQLPDLQSFSEEEQVKIVKMQAQSRGYIARKQVKDKRETSETTATTSSTQERTETTTEQAAVEGGAQETTTTTTSTSKEVVETKESAERTETVETVEVLEAKTEAAQETIEAVDVPEPVQETGVGSAAEGPLAGGAAEPEPEQDAEGAAAPAGSVAPTETEAEAQPAEQAETVADTPPAEAEPEAQVEAADEAPAPAEAASAEQPAAPAAAEEATGPSGSEKPGAEAPAAAAAEADAEAGSAMVTFVVKPENIKYAREVAITMRCHELKLELYDELRILPDALTLKLGEAEWVPSMTLGELGVQTALGMQAGGDVEMELVINLGNKMKPRADLAPGELPAYVDVQVEMGPGQGSRLIQVFIDQDQEKKPYLGGFRNKKTGATYHHACTQTPRKPKYSEADRKLSRETQTYETKTLQIQTTREQATQMKRPGVLLSESQDYFIIPGPYQTADELLRIKVQKAIQIQCASRAWLARRRANELRQQKLEREDFLREQELSRREAEAKKRRYEIQRRMHPRTAADFEILYNELEETSKIKTAGLSPEVAQEALQQLLSKETKLLQTIDRLKTAANAENKSLRIGKTLKDMSSPKKWDLSNGKTVQVHTPFTTRAKELSQLYNGLNLPLLTTDERLDVLLHVKWTVKEFDCNLTREIVELVDREADLLNRGRSPKTMEGLRKRIASMFLAFIETPEFNPEAGRFQIVPMDFDGYQQSPMEGTAPRNFGTVNG